MPRKMKKGKTTLTVTRHIMTRNMWEYYLTDDVMEGTDGDIVRALVMGIETELGDVSLKELKPYMISNTADLSELAPAGGWSWV
jgi:hypothetical protein